MNVRRRVPRLTSTGAITYMAAKKRIVTLILGVAISTSAVYARSSEPPEGIHTREGPVWSVLATAYTSRQDSLIRLYTKSDQTALRLYADALMSLANRDYSRLKKTGKACEASPSHSDAGPTELFACLLTVARGAGVMGTAKDRAIWLSRAKQYYFEHEAEIEHTTGSKDPAGLGDIHIPVASSILNWPNERVTVASDWKIIQMHHGTVLGKIDETSLPFYIDTGSTGINISDKDVAKFKLTKDLIPLSYVSVADDQSGNLPIRMYYVRKLRFGPVAINDAYVSTSASETVIGIAALSALSRFSITSDEIRRIGSVSALKGACGPMHFTRMPIATSVTYPFFVVPGTGGNFGLMLDSGMHTFGTVHNAIVSISSRRASSLIKASQLRNIKMFYGELVQNGKVVRHPLVEFSINLAGMVVQGIESSSDALFVDPELDGILNFNALKHASITYDFFDRRMCITSGDDAGHL